MRQNDRENEDACNTLSSAWHDGADAKLHRNLFSGFSIIHREDVQNQTIICANSSTILCEGASIMTTRQRTCFSAFAGKLDFSSREDSAWREHETCFVTGVCRGIGADILKAALVADQTAFLLENST